MKIERDLGGVQPALFVELQRSERFRRPCGACSRARRTITGASTIHRSRLTTYTHAVHARRRADRPSGLGRSGEHAAPGRLLKRGITSLPCIGDGRQSGTSASPSIVNASPEAAAGGGLALLTTGDRVRHRPQQGHGEHAGARRTSWRARRAELEEQAWLSTIRKARRPGRRSSAA